MEPTQTPAFGPPGMGGAMQHGAPMPMGGMPMGGMPPVAPVRRGVGIPVVAGVVALCLLGAVGFAFGYLIGGGKPTGGPNEGTRWQRAAAVPIVQTLNSQAALYKLQHQDLCVDLVTFPNWEQFTQFTDERGTTVSPTKTPATRYGPYMQSVPVNPLNKLSAVMVAGAEPVHGDAVPGGQAVGFVHWPAKDRFYVTDVSGTRVIDVMRLAEEDQRRR